MNQSPAKIGRLVGKYRLRGLLGRGGMGVVYLAHDPRLQRDVALKLLHRERVDANLAERFLREARAAARLHHPNVVSIYEADEFDGEPYFVMEYVRGVSADQLLRRGPLPWSAATAIAAQAARALVAAHAAGLIHRDVKPSNLLLAADGTVKLTDFGLVKLVAQGQTTLSGAGEVCGTPHFMSPEQARSQPLDERTDQYSLGATYYTLLTGAPPYPGNEPLPLLYAHCGKPVPDPCRVNPAVPAGAAAIVQRAMAKKRGDRYPNAAALLADLEALLGDETPQLAELVSTTEPPATLLETPLMGPPPRSHFSRRRWLLFAGGGLFLAGTGTVAALWHWWPRPAPTRSEPSPEPEKSDTEPTRPLTVEEQLRRLTAELRRRNPEFQGEPKALPRKGRIVELTLSTEHVRDIAPLAELTHLEELSLEGPGRTGSRAAGQLRDLRPLKGLRLRCLVVACNPVDDLSPLLGMPLGDLDCSNTKVRDLKPLRDLPLHRLDCHGCPLDSLQPLENMTTLTELRCGTWNVKDLGPVKDLPLHIVSLYGSQVSDLSPLAGKELLYLDCGATRVRSLASMSGSRVKHLKIQQLRLDDLNDLTLIGALEEIDLDQRPGDEVILHRIKTLRVVNGMTRK
jgi:serine/threonine protein kinase